MSSLSVSSSNVKDGPKYRPDDTRHVGLFWRGFMAYTYYLPLSSCQSADERAGWQYGNCSEALANMPVNS